MTRLRLHCMQNHRDGEERQPEHYLGSWVATHGALPPASVGVAAGDSGLLRSACAASGAAAAAAAVTEVTEVTEVRERHVAGGKAA